VVAEGADAREILALLRVVSLPEEASNPNDATAESTTVIVVEAGTSVVYAAAATATEKIETAMLEYGGDGNGYDDEEHFYTYATADADAEDDGDDDEDDDTDTRVAQAGEDDGAKEEYATEGYITGTELESEDGDDGYVTGDSSEEDNKERYTTEEDSAK
jgi:hypothetical protein